MGRKQNDVLNTKPLVINLPIDKSENDGLYPQKKTFIQPNIGLEIDVRIPVVEILNASLANEAVLTQKTRSAHWNVSGKDFFELHILFETQYKQLNEISDKIAGRVRMLGGIAIASFEEFLKHTRIMEHSTEIPDNLHLLADHETVIRILREDIKKCSEEYEDEGTVELLVGVMSLHEKIAWMLRAYIENDPINGNGQKRKSKDE
jgi:starvation-inducible DNA-binding protein